MKLTHCAVLAGALLVASATSVFAKIERVVEKTFAVSSGGTLRIESQGGDIRVNPGSEGTVKITARQKIRARDDAEADEVLKKLEFSLEQNGNDVTALARYEKPPLGIHLGSWPPVSVDFTVTVPPGYRTDLRTSGGEIVLGDLSGQVVARTSGGGIRLGKITAPLDARTSGGNIALEAGHGAVKLSTSGGNVNVGRITGEADLGTSGGSIKVDAVEGSLRAHTSGGGVRVTFLGSPKEDSSLSTSGGSIRVQVDKTAAFRLDAVTSGGSVDAEGLTLTLDKSGHGQSRLSGAVNGGGPTLKLRTSGGGIEVRTR